jgi:hypothetical protein
MEKFYGIDFINPKYRGLRLGRRLYDVRKIVRAIESEIYHFAGRIPNYGKFKDEITKVYIEK